MKPQKNTKILEEMRGAERVFRIDRDTLVVYTGRDREDISPFVRFGAGEDIPFGLLKNIDTVIVPESLMWNLGYEVAWQQMTLMQGADAIRYVGSKESTAQIYNFTWLDDNDEETHKEKVKMEQYVQQNQLQGNRREHSYITFYGTGNLILEVNGSKVLDLNAYRRLKIHVDKEYDLIAKAQSKTEPRAAEGNSFIYLGTENGHLPFLYWNFKANGLVMHPTAEYHYELFQNRLSPESVNMALSSVPYHPGFVEVVRRKDVEQKPVGVCTQSPERLSLLGKIFRKTKLLAFGDGKALPFAKDVFFYLSRTGSHGLFSIKPDQNAEHPVQLLFPVASGVKESRSFDYSRGPFDIEMVAANQKEDLKLPVNGYLRLHFPGTLDVKSYMRASLAEGVFPLLPGAQYSLSSSDKVSDLIDGLTASITDTEFYEPVHNLFNYFGVGDPADSKHFYELIREVKKIKTVPDPLLRINLFECFRFMLTSDVFKKLKPIHQRAFRRLSNQFHSSKIQIRELYALPTKFIDVTVYIFQGKWTSLVVHQHKPDIVELQFPPGVTQIETEKGEYRALLRRQNKILDKSIDDVTSLRMGLEMMEKLFEDRLAMYEERKRLSSLLDALGMSLETIEEPQRKRLALPEFVPPQFSALFEKGTERVRLLYSKISHWLHEKMGPVTDGIRDFKGVILLALLALFLGIGGYYGWKAFSGTASTPPAAAAEKKNGGVFSWLFGSGKNRNGVDEHEANAADLVSPGEFQNDLLVPGETDITPIPTEVMSYANALAGTNGFAKIRKPIEGDERDPELIFPGDRLELPDGRLIHVTPGETIWQLANRNYRKDFARIKILERQILNISENGNDEDEIRTKIEFMKRLAVTPIMQQFIQITEKKYLGN